jgi:chromosome segregation ATPase
MGIIHVEHIKSLQYRVERLKELAFEIGDENKGLKREIKKLYRDIEELTEEKRDLTKLVFDSEKENEQYKELIGAIANIDGAFITGEGECDFTDKQALDKIMEWVEPIWNDIAQSQK